MFYLQEKPIVTVLNKEEVTVQNLMSRMAESGLTPIPLDDFQFLLRTESGIGFHVSIEEDRQFVRIHTYLPTSRTKSHQEKLEYAHRLSAEIFMPTFSLDADDDILVSYVHPYQFGLIADLFPSLVKRFASLLEYVVQSFDTDGMFDFTTAAVATDASTTVGELDAPLATDEPQILH